VSDVPGVGISFGIDRIYDVMQELSLFPESLTEGTSVLFFNLGAQESLYSFNLMNECRNRGISCELFYESAKMDKQFKYAEKKKIPLVVIIGSREMSDKKCKIKNLNTGVEDTVEASELAAYLIKKL
ncbi:MAG TPA: His/Gly/Thr/Pro-type tRNA ligase C-terminal domain-containing protein, partial [Ginsengibacter sp.]|nr:His/Gly/Thr/Pro-type tRNA ligase C-terminal domain-containing protein [Ginsengibacter sp.]